MVAKDPMGATLATGGWGGGGGGGSGGGAAGGGGADDDERAPPLLKNADAPSLRRACAQLALAAVKENAAGRLPLTELAAIEAQVRSPLACLLATTSLALLSPSF